ncbi:hypothetical protein BJX70DRAFT_403377 [Aspergillus crustosus]
MCNDTPAQRCTRCLRCYYCSQECQKQDFPTHKLLCKAFRPQSARPSPKHKRVILFPADKAKPEVLWVGVSEVTGDTEWFPHLGQDDPVICIERLMQNLLRGRSLGNGPIHLPGRDVRGYSILLIATDSYMLDGSNPNTSIITSVAPLSSVLPSHRGPVIAIRETADEDYGDIQLSDFRHILDYFGQYQFPEIPKSMPGFSIGKSKAALPLFGAGDISPISVKLGMPLKLWRYSKQDPDINHGNQNVAFLMLNIDPDREEFSWAPRKWNFDVGSVLVVREDGKHLDLKDLTMMCSFARHKMQQMFEIALEKEADEIEREMEKAMESGMEYEMDKEMKGKKLQARQKVVDFMTWDNMVDYWENGSVGEAGIVS